MFDFTFNTLKKSIKDKQSWLCVGLDPDPEKLPAGISRDPEGVFQFCTRIMEATAPHSVSFKVNTAFFEALGPDGWECLNRVCEFSKKNFPGHFLIADAKRGDIGNTSAMYARAFFTAMNFDAITVAPYMGSDSILPFLKFNGKWVIVLGLTSNEGANDFQLNGKEPLYEKVIQRVSDWGTKNNLMFVAGATRPEYLKRIREIVPDHFLLIPGVGTQGGDLKQVLKNGMGREGALLINASRSIIYASAEKDFSAHAAAEAHRLSAEMKAVLTEL
jgi:orotidine-5'-phosphate decarboxylase